MHVGETLKRYEADRQQVRGYASVGWEEEKIPIWSRSQEVVAALEFSKEDVPHYRHIEGVASGAEVKPPLQFFQRKTVLGSVADRFGRPTLSFQLPEKPFEPSEFSNEHFIVSITAPHPGKTQTNGARSGPPTFQALTAGTAARFSLADESRGLK
jgi:hypothetical protein